MLLVQVDDVINVCHLGLAADMRRMEHDMYGRDVGRLFAQVLRNTSAAPFSSWSDVLLTLLACFHLDALCVWHASFVVLDQHLQELRVSMRRDGGLGLGILLPAKL